MSTRPARHRAERTPLTRRLALAMGALATVGASIAVTGSSSASFTSSSGSTGSVSAAADWTPPNVSITSPTANGIVSGTTKIAAGATDDVSGVASVTIQRKDAGNGVWTDICGPIRTAPFSCDWVTKPSVSDGAHDLRAIAVDKAGNEATSATVRVNVSNAFTVTLGSLGDYVRGTVSTTATLTNVGTLTISSVEIEYAPVGSSNWSSCAATRKPNTDIYTCSVNTSPAPNGAYKLRAVAVAGPTKKSYYSEITNVIVDNLAPTVTMTDPGATLKGVKPFAATASDAHSGIAKVVIEASSDRGWSVVCTMTGAPYSCTYDTFELPNGTYSFRAIATDRAGNSTTSTVTKRVVSNVDTSVTLTPSRTVVNATADLKVAAVSNTVASVKVERSVAGAGTWSQVCSSTSASSTCTMDTKSLSEGSYDLRAIVTDADGRTATSAIATIRVDHTPPGKALEIRTTNVAGGTQGRIEKGDTIVYTFSKQMDLSTIYAGWTGEEVGGRVQLENEDFWSGKPNEVLQLAGTGSADIIGSVALNADYFLTPSLTGSLTMTMSAKTVTIDGVARTVVTVNIEKGPSPFAVPRTADAANMVWTPSSSITDLAGNPIDATSVTETDNDVDF